MKIKIDYQKPVVCVFVDGILMADFPSDELISFLVGYLTCLERVHVCSFPLSFEVRYVED